jgi:hypothetical protein
LAATFTQYVTILPSPPAALTSAARAVDLEPRPPWMKALQRPKAAGPVAFGPLGAEVGAGVGSSDSVGDGLGVAVSVGVGVGDDSVSVGVGAGDGVSVAVAVGLGDGVSVSVAVGVGDGDSVSVGVGDGDSASETVRLSCRKAVMAVQPVPLTTKAPATITVAASLFPVRVNKDMR